MTNHLSASVLFLPLLICPYLSLLPFSLSLFPAPCTSTPLSLCLSPQPPSPPSEMCPLWEKLSVTWTQTWELLTIVITILTYELSEQVFTWHKLTTCAGAAGPHVVPGEAVKRHRGHDPCQLCTETRGGQAACHAVSMLTIVQCSCWLSWLSTELTDHWESNHWVYCPLRRVTIMLTDHSVDWSLSTEYIVH